MYCFLLYLISKTIKILKYFIKYMYTYVFYIKQRCNTDTDILRYFRFMVTYVLFGCLIKIHSLFNYRHVNIAKRFLSTNYFIFFIKLLL